MRPEANHIFRRSRKASDKADWVPTNETTAAAQTRTTTVIVFRFIDREKTPDQ